MSIGGMLKGPGENTVTIYAVYVEMLCVCIVDDLYQLQNYCVVDVTLHN